ECVQNKACVLDLQPMDPLQKQYEFAKQVRQLVGPNARAILTVTPKGNYLVGVDDAYVGMQLRIQGKYATHEIQTLSRLCNDRTRLLVVGAQIGALTIQLAKVCNAVVAIEAIPETFELLRLNIQLNGVSNCRAIHKAASSRFETIEFVVSRVNSGGSKRSPIV